MKERSKKEEVTLALMDEATALPERQIPFQSEHSRVAFKLATQLREHKEVRSYSEQFSRRTLLKMSEYLSGSEIAYQVNEDGTLDLFSQDQFNTTSIEARLDRPFGHTHPRGDHRRKNLVPSLTDFRALAFKMAEGGRKISDHIHTVDPQGREMTFAYTIEKEGIGKIFYSLPKGKRLVVQIPLNEKSLGQLHDSLVLRLS